MDGVCTELSPLDDNANGGRGAVGCTQSTYPVSASPRLLAFAPILSGVPCSDCHSDLSASFSVNEGIEFVNKYLASYLIDGYYHYHDHQQQQHQHRLPLQILWHWLSRASNHL